MQISTEAVKALRDKTGAGIMDCKRTLEETQGDAVKAQEILRRKGLAAAEKRANRVASQGLIEVYVHAGGRIGAMVELNCETDFVARTPEFKELAHNLALQVAATKPLCISSEEMTPDTQGDPKELCLLAQPFIRDPERTVQDIVNDATARIREKISVRRFARFELGN